MAESRTGTILVCTLLIATSVSGRYDGANCSRVQLCNGVMCDSICKPGTVWLDPFVRDTLAFQRQLQFEEPLVRATLIGTHNSAISQAYGFGIEQDFIANLTGEPMYRGDDLGEGVCQSLSVLDQLRLGLRHIEIDINSGWEKLHLDETFVCHSPVPLAPGKVLEIEAKALAKGIKLGWKPEKLSCLGTSIKFKTMLSEIQEWLLENPREIVVLYLDVKPGCVALPAQTSSAFQDMREVFGDSIWAVEDGDPLAVSQSEMLKRGKRVIFEDHSDGWRKPKHGEKLLVFTPDLWSHQFGKKDLKPFPNCSIYQDPMKSWYAPVGYNGTGNKYELVRGLSYGRVTEGDDVQGAMDCGVNILSPNYISPPDLEGFVWTFSRKTFKGLDCTGCVALLRSGEWGILPLSNCTIQRPVACRALNDDSSWTFGGKGLNDPPCPSGYTLAAPTNGFANKHLKKASELYFLLHPFEHGVFLPIMPNGTKWST